MLTLVKSDGGAKMDISYDVFTGAFLSKITEYDLLEINEDIRTDIIDGYMKRAMSQFQHISKVKFVSAANDETRTYTVDFEEDDELTEIADIVSDGMIVQWLKPYLNRQELLESVLNTRDYTTYSPAEMLRRVGEAHTKAQSDFTAAMREYSFNHNDLSRLHL
jgi:hypothetical protein